LATRNWRCTSYDTCLDKAARSDSGMLCEACNRKWEMNEIDASDPFPIALLLLAIFYPPEEGIQNHSSKAKTVPD
jgi:hypothetical protein